MSIDGKLNALIYKISNSDSRDTNRDESKVICNQIAKARSRSLYRNRRADLYLFYCVL
jgi:hypothetical protein